MVKQILKFTFLLSFFVIIISCSAKKQIETFIPKSSSVDLKLSKIRYFDKKDDGGWLYATSGITSSTMDREGNIYLIGTYAKNDTNKTDTILIKISKDANELWRRVYKEPNQKKKDFVAENISVDKSGYIYLCGVLTSDYHTSDERNITSMRIDPKGDFLWSKYIDTNTFSDTTAITFDKDQNIISSGEISHTFKSKFEKDSCEIFILKNHKDKLKGRLYSIRVSYNRTVKDIFVDKRGDIYLFGSLFIVDGNKYRSFISKVSRDGKLLWDRVIDDKFSKGILGRDGYLYIASISKDKKNRVNLSKIDSLGKILWSRGIYIKDAKYVDAIYLDRSKKIYIAINSIKDSDDENLKSTMKLLLFSNDGELIKKESFFANYCSVDKIFEYKNRLYLTGSQYSKKQPKFNGYENKTSGSGNLFVMIFDMAGRLF